MIERLIPCITPVGAHLDRDQRNVFTILIDKFLLEIRKEPVAFGKIPFAFGTLLSVGTRTALFTRTVIVDALFLPPEWHDTLVSCVDDVECTIAFLIGREEFVVGVTIKISEDNLRHDFGSGVMAHKL